jgi:hypothetical protein
MNKKIVLLFALLLPALVFAQKVKVKYDVPSGALGGLHNFLGVEKYKVKLKGPNLKDAEILLRVKEIRRGEIKIIDTLVNPAFDRKFMGENGASKSKYQFEVYCRYSRADTSYLLFLQMPNYQINEAYKALRPGGYSLRDAMSCGDKNLAVDFSQPIPVLALALPHNDPDVPGYGSYCDLTLEGVSPYQWWDRYKVDHYYIFEFVIQ